MTRYIYETIPESHFLEITLLLSKYSEALHFRAPKNVYRPEQNPYNKIYCPSGILNIQNIQDWPIIHTSFARIA
jgi:hypothetical protein